MVTRDPVLVLNGQEPGIFIFYANTVNYKLYVTKKRKHKSYTGGKNNDSLGRTESTWLIAQVTDEDEIKEMVNNGKATFYIGFDPTADSLHVGHFMALCLMKRLQMAGNRPIALLGGGTGMIGDPSGRTDMRQMLTKETIQHNIDCFKQQMSRFIDFSDEKLLW